MTAAGAVREQPAAPAETAAAYPRVLVLAANPFSRRHNNGLAMSSLFQGWPADRLAQIYVPFVTPVPPDFDVCRRFWALTPRGLRPVPVPPAAVAEAPAAARTPTAARRLLLRLAQSPFLQKIAYPAREAVYSRRSLLSGPEMAEVDRFAPEVIFSLFGSLSLLRIGLRLAERYGVPLVPLITDDWITTEYGHVFGARRLRRELEAAFGRMLERAPVRMVVSDAMAGEYRARYGGEYLPFTRCIEAADFPATPARGGEGRTLELVYAGQLGLDRWKGLRRIGEELRALRDEGVDARLTVYTVPAHIELYREALTMDPVVRLAGSVPNERLPALYDAADVLVHVESFDPRLAEYTRFSLSTKVSEYLMTGRPILGMGPPDIGSMLHIARSGGGVVVGEEGNGALRAALRSLLSDARRRAELGARGRAFALERHEASGQREAFRAALARAAASTG